MGFDDLANKKDALLQALKSARGTEDKSSDGASGVVSGQFRRVARKGQDADIEAEDRRFGLRHAGARRDAIFIHAKDADSAPEVAFARTKLTEIQVAALRASRDKLSLEAGRDAEDVAL